MDVVAGTLYVVGTPLGNLGDFSPRAREVLAGVDGVLAEDTRRTRALLTHFALHKPLRSLHAHNEHGSRAQVLAQLAEGKSLALVSDAGTPAVSDPGASLIAAAHEAGASVSCIPGPSALSAAMSVAGFAHEVGDALFVGFLPRAGSSRKAALKRLTTFAGIGVLFESPTRLATTLRELSALAPARLACVCRELTKLHEELRRGPLETLAAWADDHRVRGECTVVLGPRAPLGDADPEAPEGQPLPHPAEAVRRCLAAGLRVRDAASAVAALLGVPRRQAYALALAAGAEAGETGATEEETELGSELEPGPGADAPPPPEAPAKR